MILQLLLLAVAFFGACLVLQPTEQFTYARNADDIDTTAAPILPRARCIIGYILCISAMTAILIVQ